MTQSQLSTAPRFGLETSLGIHPVQPVRIDGHRAEVVIAGSYATTGAACLHVEWDDGRQTALDVSLGKRRNGGLVAHLDIHGVGGDWQPFLEYVAHTNS
jgi:hypothetical protein